MSQELIDRWADFLGKVSERLDAIIAEAGPGVLGIGRAHPTDPLPLGNALTGLDHRVRQLEDRIEAVWDDKVEAQFSEVGGAVHDRGIDMRDDAKMAHRQRWERAKAGWLTTLAHEAAARAQAAEAGQVSCSRCGAPLQLPTRRVEVDRRSRAAGWAKEGLESLERWREMELAQWQAYADEKAARLGEPVDEAYVPSRMAQFDKYNLHTNQTWVRAHGKG